MQPVLRLLFGYRMAYIPGMYVSLRDLPRREWTSPPAAMTPHSLTVPATMPRGVYRLRQTEPGRVTYYAWDGTAVVAAIQMTDLDFTYEVLATLADAIPDPVPAFTLVRGDARWPSSLPDAFGPPPGLVLL